MTAYVLIRLDIRDRAWIGEYLPTTEALIQKHGGRIMVRVGSRGIMESLEGDGKLPSAIVVVEFPSVEHAKGWYNDPDYAPLIALRQSGSDAEMIVVQQE